ncbi:MAG: hypothetical protein KDA33_07000 [Phycisphaerales bacterium]|nr:hypothetical protein [Phycisphaerales bacterium]
MLARAKGRTAIARACAAWVVLLSLVTSAEEPAPGKAPPQAGQGERLTIELQPRQTAPAPEPVRFTVRVTPESLAALFETDLLPISLRLESEKAAAIASLSRVSMEAVLDELGPLLRDQYSHRFDPERDLIVVPVPTDRRILVQAPDIFPDGYEGPKHQTVGFLLHDVSEAEYVKLGIRIIQTARQLIDTGRPEFDRTSQAFIQGLARREVAEIRDARRAGAKADEESAAIRQRVGKALKLEGADLEGSGRNGDWLKESRRFSYIIREGEFIQRLCPLVDRINREMDVAGFRPPSSLDKPGIHYDKEIGDVEIVLPKTMMRSFLAEADQLERRMAEDAIISIEAVRLTDRDITSGALASRFRGQWQGTHDYDAGVNQGTVLREVGLNSLLAVANQQLQVRTLQGIASGALPAGTTPVAISAPTLPPLPGATYTTIGTEFSAGADDLFFDGREQVAGFSYIGPDGIKHTLTSEVVDSLREFWDRIERNLIVHKIKKTDVLTEYTVPVGPNTNTYRGIAALISQENQQQVVATGTGAISKIEATAGTWLIIEGFNITPIPGSSTTLTEEERSDLISRVQLTMFLRDANMPSDLKQRMLASRSNDELRAILTDVFRQYRTRTIRQGRDARTYDQVFQDRYDEALEDAAIRKKEANSSISLTFYSSQGNIIQQAGATQLGDANDLTSFTTELGPNQVTPISSFFTKSGSGATGTSPLTGADRGERVDEEKTMTHLLIRARFPTADRERRDRDEGRHLGYFQLPVQRDPSSTVDVPFLSSSEHPSERLAKLRVGLGFEILDPSRVRRPLSPFNPNRFPGDVPEDVFRLAATRYGMMQRIIADSPGASPTMATDYRERFIVEVRSLLEYDRDFFDSPNFSLRNMSQWNRPERIMLTLDNSPNRFALKRLVQMLDELGQRLVTDAYALDYLAVSPKTRWPERRRVYPIGEHDLRMLRRDVAAHYLRMGEAFGDAFLEAISRMLGLGTYQSRDIDVLESGPFRGYQDLVVFDNSGTRNGLTERYEAAHDEFLFLRAGGREGQGIFEKSRVSLDDMEDANRRLVYLGPDILTSMESLQPADD